MHAFLYRYVPLYNYMSKALLNFRMCFFEYLIDLT